MKSLLPLVSAVMLWWSIEGAAAAAAIKLLKPFLEQHCVECHNAETNEGDLNLADLTFEAAHDASLDVWKRVFERVRDGEMPPQNEVRPDKAEADRFLMDLEKPLLQSYLANTAKNGRVQSRRLTRVEYEHTLHDLLGIDIPLKDLLPEDPESNGFETVAAGQQLSHYQLARYLDVADIALDDAFQRALKGDVVFKKQCTPEQLVEGIGRGNYRGPELRDGRSISWPLGIQFFGRMLSTKIPSDGWYRITLRDVQAINPGKDGSVWGTLRSGICFANAPLLYMIGVVEATDKPRDLVFEAWVQKDHILELKPNDGELKKAKSGSSRGGTVSFKGRDLEKDGYSGIAHRGLEIESIHPNANHESVRRNLFGDQDPNNLNVNAKSTFKNIASDFANRAFRRKLNDAQLAPYLEIGSKALAEGDSVADALRASYRAMLCSPRFLTFVEAPGELDEYAVAARLSYALWVSMPDDELTRLANNGRLREPNVLAKQIDRMLSDAKAERFVRSFTDQWLKLNEIDFTSPDDRQFRDFDAVVQESMLQETRAFVALLIQENLSVANLIDSDFAFLNGRLARHYRNDVSVRPGDGLQKVALAQSPEKIRGGLITQGAILKVTADGTSTSPVVRGVFINERILGQTIPPPPPGIPAIEPDIRGAKSIRDQLDKHRSDSSCASCHMTIDPPGFALECFDPVGGWRSRYGTGANGVAVNSEGVTPEGEKFANLIEWKRIYRNREEQLARGFAEQFLTYATGAPIEFGDRPIVHEIVARSKASNFGLRSIIQAALTSSVFLNK